VRYAARFKTLLGKDGARLPLAVIWLFTWPGGPLIARGAVATALATLVTPAAALLALIKRQSRKTQR
jgi:hypothetical protein